MMDKVQNSSNSDFLICLISNYVFRLVQIFSFINNHVVVNVLFYTDNVIKRAT
jgi:hypothetical protein